MPPLPSSTLPSRDEVEAETPDLAPISNCCYEHATRNFVADFHRILNADLAFCRDCAEVSLVLRATVLRLLAPFPTVLSTREKCMRPQEWKTSTYMIC